VGA
ncbi:unnamed protein product, partial [Diplocarpon coronariae]|jgi:hypothetical protein